MNAEKIGKLIADCRKKKKMTQIEFAKRIGVSNKAVSKWENGRGIPDWGVFDNICNELDITLNELLNGELNTNDDKVINDYINYKRLQNKRYCIILGIIILLLVGLTYLGIYFYNYFDKVNVYELSGSGDRFKYSEAFYFESNLYLGLIKGDLKYKEDDQINIIDTQYAVKIEDKYYKIYVDAYTTQIENYGYNDVFDEELLDYIPDNLYMLVFYEYNNESLVDYIKLNFKLIATNGKLLSQKVKDIGSTKKSDYLNREIDLDMYDNVIKWKRQLVDQGFKVEEDSIYNLCKIENKEHFCISVGAGLVSYYNTVGNEDIKVYSFQYDEYEFMDMIISDNNTNQQIFRFQKYYENGDEGCGDKDCELYRDYEKRFKYLVDLYRYKDE